MPIREYICKEGFAGCFRCSKPFELLEQAGAPVLERCPLCKTLVTRLYSAPRVINGTHLDDRAKKAGFHKLKRLSHGEYEKQY